MSAPRKDILWLLRPTVDAIFLDTNVSDDGDVWKSKLYDTQLPCDVSLTSIQKTRSTLEDFTSYLRDGAQVTPGVLYELTTQYSHLQNKLAFFNQQLQAREQNNSFAPNYKRSQYFMKENFSDLVFDMYQMLSQAKRNVFTPDNQLMYDTIFSDVSQASKLNGVFSVDQTSNVEDIHIVSSGVYLSAKHNKRSLLVSNDGDVHRLLRAYTLMKSQSTVSKHLLNAPVSSLFVTPESEPSVYNSANILLHQQENYNRYKRSLFFIQD